MNQTINQRIGIYRRLAGLSQAKAAEKLGMKCSTYSQMERRGKISTQMLLKLAAVFNVHPDELLYGNENIIKPNVPAEETKTMKEPLTPPIPQKNDNSPVMILTNSEENMIKIIRNLPRADRDEVLAFVEKMYKKNK